MRARSRWRGQQHSGANERASCGARLDSVRVETLVVASVGEANVTDGKALSDRAEAGAVKDGESLGDTPPTSFETSLKPSTARTCEWRALLMKKGVRPVGACTALFMANLAVGRKSLHAANGAA